MSDLPLVTGASGLTGRPPVRPEPEIVPDEDAPDEPLRMGRSMPSSCQRVLYAPRPLDCQPGCVGQQDDGGCLCDVVRAAEAAGVAWEFEVRVDEGGQHWLYVGPPLG